jgi:hypothetical protein
MAEKPGTMNPSLVAVRYNNTDAILDILQSYYSQLGLGLVEERIGSGSGKYATSPKQYLGLADYYAKERSTRPERQEFTTDFDLIENREKCLGWKIFFYYPYWADLTLGIDEKLAQEVSKSLKAKVVEYFFQYEIDGDKIVVRGWTDGQLIDHLIVKQGKLIRGDGFFSELLPEDEVDVILERIYGYGDINNLDLEYIDIEDNQDTRRPMYLKGKPEIIKGYLASLKK